MGHVKPLSIAVTPMPAPCLHMFLYWFASRAGRPLSHRSHGPSGIVSCTSFAGGEGVRRRVLGEFEIFWLGVQGLGVEIWGMGREVLEFREKWPKLLRKGGLSFFWTT